MAQGAKPGEGGELPGGKAHGGINKQYNLNENTEQQ